MASLPILDMEDVHGTNNGVRELKRCQFRQRWTKVTLLWFAVFKVVEVNTFDIDRLGYAHAYIEPNH